MARSGPMVQWMRRILRRVLSGFLVTMAMMSLRRWDPASCEK